MTDLYLLSQKEINAFSKGVTLKVSCYFTNQLSYSPQFLFVKSGWFGKLAAQTPFLSLHRSVALPFKTWEIIIIRIMLLMMR